MLVMMCFRDMVSLTVELLTCSPFAGKTTDAPM